MNTPITKAQVKDLPKGFTPTASAPNRKDRRHRDAREMNNRKGNRVQIITHSAGRHTKFTNRKQYLNGKTILHRD